MLRLRLILGGMKEKEEEKEKEGLEEAGLRWFLGNLGFCCFGGCQLGFNLDPAFPKWELKQRKNGPQRVPKVVQLPSQS